MKSQITTHVLDTSIGRPAKGIRVALQRRLPDGTWNEVGSGMTSADGRVNDLLTSVSPTTGVHRLCFDTGSYFKQHGVAAFYPSVDITFTIHDASEHYHVPLLLNPFGYATYRGS